MKKILIISMFMGLLVLPNLFASGSDESGGSVTLAHNKVEIDAPLKAIASEFSSTSGIDVTIKTCGGDSCSLETQLRADFNAGEAPDIFVIDGIEGYKVWEEYIADLSGESWVKLTDLEFIAPSGKVVGFPVAVEGWGMGYNVDLLNKAGIDPNTLTSYGAYEAAFKKIDGMKAELGIDSVVSMTAGSGMHWVTSHHNVNSYLSNGLERDDLTYVDMAKEGKLDIERYREYAKWVKLLFDYSDQKVLVAGDYDAQVGAFANQMAVFIHQGNWIEPNLEGAGATFDRKYTPHGSSTKTTDGVFVSAPTWYVVNKDGNVATAKAFLKFLAEDERGHDYMVNQAKMIPAFTNVKLQPSAKLSASLLEWIAKGKTYAWNQYHLPGEFRDQVLGPLYEQLAKREITLDEFISLSEKAYADVPNLLQ